MVNINTKIVPTRQYYRVEMAFGDSDVVDGIATDILFPRNLEGYTDDDRVIFNVHSDDELAKVIAEIVDFVVRDRMTREALNG